MAADLRGDLLGRPLLIMAIWPALIVVPLLALADQSVAYALAPWLCAKQNALSGHVVHAVFLLAMIIASVPAWRAMRRLAPREKEASESAPVLAVVGSLIALLSITILFALWIPQWVLSPCFT